MESRQPFSPLPPHRGRHAGIVALGLLGAATGVAWVSRTHDPTPDFVTPRRPAVASIESQLAPITVDESTSTAPVEERSIPHVVVASGAVTYDHHRTNHVFSPVTGVFVKTRPSSHGRVVRAGETLGSIYSLEVWLATVDLLAELKDFQSQEKLDQQRMRLQRWGMRRDRVAKLEQAMVPSAELPVIARVSGTVVVEQNAGAQRMLVDPSMGEVMTITDPAYATVYVEVPANDAELLRIDAPAQVSIGSQRPVTAPIGYIAPTVVDGSTMVRVDLHPYKAKMPPAATANIELLRTTLNGASIPAAAVVRDGTRTLAYVVRGEIAEPRDIRLGPATDGFVLVIEGVAIGDRVALRK
jgi:membrane fusion protein, copper/silver efflux system